MRVNARHSAEARGKEFYRTGPEAIASFIAFEEGFIPLRIWEPCAGDGAIAKPLRAAGYKVLATDIVDRGAGYRHGLDYLKVKVPSGCEAIVTNPPFSLATEMVNKALGEVTYHAWLLPLSFLESQKRIPLFRDTPPARVWVSSRRLPMMHRDGWQGKEADSNKCFAWFIWDDIAPRKNELRFFDWQDYQSS